MSFTVIPALDIRDDSVVRLRQGDYERQTTYAVDPVDTAAAYADAGATWLHLVDLDAARRGGWSLGDLVGRVVADTGLRVQSGGGVRSVDDVRAILDAGATRVVVGSLAVRQPELIARWLGEFGPDAITVALDARPTDQGWDLPTAGWTEPSGVDLTELLARYADAGLRHALCTDISRDGTMAGPGLELYRLVTAAAPTVEVQASGGIRCLDDLRAVAEAGCRGAVLGRALLDGAADLDDLIQEAATW